VGVAGYGTYLNGSSVGTTSQTTYSFAGLSCGTSYTLGVNAYDAAGNRSATATLTASTGACPDTIAPTVPTGLVETSATATSISLSWSPSLDNVGLVGYDVYRNAVAVGTTSLTVYTVTGLTCGTSYMIAVDSFDAAGNRSAQTSFIAPTSPCPDVTAPTSPTNVIKTGATQISISISWNASTDNVGVAGYDLYKSGSKVATVTATNYTFTGLNCGTSYPLAAVAFDAAGNRSTQTSLSASTSACSSAPVTSALTWVWSGDYETRDFSQWTDGLLVNGNATASITSSPAVGNYAAKFEADPNLSDPLGYSRAEVQNSYPSQDGGKYGTETTYTFAEYIPSSTVFAPHASFNHIVQWHPDIDCYGDSVTVNGLKSPQTLVIRWRGGAVTNSSGGCSFETDRTWDLGPIPRGSRPMER
jgi:chitodextrinase